MYQSHNKLVYVLDACYFLRTTLEVTRHFHQYGDSEVYQIVIHELFQIYCPVLTHISTGMTKIILLSQYLDINIVYSLKLNTHTDSHNDQTSYFSFTGSVAGAQQSHRSVRADHGDPRRDGGAGTRRSPRLHLHRKRYHSADAAERVSARRRNSADPAAAGAGDDDLRRAGSGLQAGGCEGRREDRLQVPAMRSVFLGKVGETALRRRALQKGLLYQDIRERSQQGHSERRRTVSRGQQSWPLVRSWVRQRVAGWQFLASGRSDRRSFRGEGSQSGDARR